MLYNALQRNVNQQCKEQDLQAKSPSFVLLPFLLFSDDLSSLASLLLILSRAGRELILIRARVAVISSSQTTLPKAKCKRKHYITSKW